MSGPRPEDPGGPFWDPLKPGRERSPLPFLAESGPPIGRTPRQLVEERRRRRILLGALNVFGEKGFARATVQDLIDEIGISRATFYKYFSDRESCLAALNDELLLWLEAEAEAAIATAPDWASQVRAATERLVALVVSDPRIAHICGIEPALVSDQIRARRSAYLDGLATVLRKGRAHSRWGDVLPMTLEDFLVAGAISLAARPGGPDRHPLPKELGPEIAELMLLPYLGAAKARKVVRGA